MSREELVGAYVGGNVSRRVFIRGLVGLGVTIGAAVAYADVLAAQTVPTTSAADIYPEDTTTTTTSSGVGAAEAGAADPVKTDPAFTG